MVPLYVAFLGLGKRCAFSMARQSTYSKWSFFGEHRGRLYFVKKSVWCEVVSFLATE